MTIKKKSLEFSQPLFLRLAEGRSLGVKVQGKITSQKKRISIKKAGKK